MVGVVRPRPWWELGYSLERWLVGAAGRVDCGRSSRDVGVPMAPAGNVNLHLSDGCDEC
jgi:hypothetical protein